MCRHFHADSDGMHQGSEQHGYRPQDSDVQREADAQVQALFTTRKRPRLGLRTTMLRVVLPWVALLVGMSVLAIVSAAMTPAASRWLSGAGFVVSASLIFAVQARSAAASRYPMVDQVGCALLGIATAWMALRTGQAYVATVAGAVGVTAIGWAVAHNVTRLMWIVPVGICASLSDARSAYFGFTHEHFIDGNASEVLVQASPQDVLHPVSAHAPGVLELLTVSLPSPGGAWMLGMVDIMYAALLWSLVARYEIGIVRTWIGLTGGLVVAAAVPSGVPVIPLLTIGFLAVHPVPAWRAVRYSLMQLALLARPASGQRHAPRTR